MTTWQQALKRIEDSRANPTMADRLEQEFTRISEERGLTREDWIMLAAAFASRLEAAQGLHKSLPELAAGLMAAGARKSATVATKASNSKHAERRAKIGLWLRTNYTREEFQKYGGFQAALDAAKDEFCKPTNPKADGPPLSEKMFRRCAREVGYSPS